MVLIAQITDIHLGFEPDRPDELNQQRLDRVVEDLAKMEPRPDLLLATGDLADQGDRESYERLRQALSSLSVPVLYALGNHDVRANFRAVFPEAAFDGDFLHYVVQAGPLRVVVLDTLEEGRHGGAFCEVRAAWLRARLDEAPDAPTLIVQHHPPIEIGVPWITTDPAEPWVERLAACLRGRRNIVGLVCGHVHRTIAAAWEGTMVAICPSTAPQVALDIRPIDPEVPDGRDLIVADAPGYALHWFNGRELVTHWGSAAEREVLARYDAGKQDMIAERMVGR